MICKKLYVGFVINNTYAYYGRSGTYLGRHILSLIRTSEVYVLSYQLVRIAFPVLELVEMAHFERQCVLTQYLLLADRPADTVLIQAQYCQA